MAGALDDARKKDRALVAALVDQIKHPERREFRTEFEWILLSSEMLRAARRHREFLLCELGIQDSGFPSHHKRHASLSHRILWEVDKSVPRGQCDVSPDARALIARLETLGLVEPDTSKRTAAIRHEGTCAGVNAFCEAWQFGRRAHWFDTEDAESPPCYANLIDALADVSDNAFRPEAVQQWRGDVRSISMPFCLAAHRSNVLVEFVHNQQLYRAGMKDSGDWCDVSGLLMLVNAALADSTDDRRFVRVVTAGRDGCCIFGPVDEIALIASDYRVSVVEDKNELVRIDSMMPLDDFVTENRWDEIREVFNECDPDTSPDELVNLRNSSGKTVLHRAIRELRCEIALKLILDAGADINAADHYGNTPLFDVSRLEVLQFLLSQGADPGQYNCDGLTVLHTAAESGQQRLVAELLKHRIETDIRSVAPRKPDRPDSSWEAIKLTLRRTPESEQRRSGQTPLHRAAFRGRKEMVLMLMSHDADPRAKDSEGLTPEDLAKIGGHAEMTPFC